ncbi:DUF397 domain-containing protein [Actinosynnema sp. NPDC002837]
MWRKSTRSNGGGNGNCVEVSLSGGSARVRDSKNPAGPTVALPDWTAFVAAVKKGSYDG